MWNTISKMFGLGSSEQKINTGAALHQPVPIPSSLTSVTTGGRKHKRRSNKRRITHKKRTNKRKR